MPAYFRHIAESGRKYARLLLVVTLLFQMPDCNKKPAAIRMTDYLLNNHLTTRIDSLKIMGVFDTLLANSLWSGRVRVNSSYDRQKINVYVINSDLSFVKQDLALAKLVGNCAYAGSNVFFIDVAYTSSFLDKHHVIKLGHGENQLDDQKCFYYWIIGHELGHMICGHLHGDFEANKMDQQVKNSLLSNTQELQADSFFVQKILPDVRLRISEERLMMDILNAEIEQKIGPVQTQGVGIIYDYTNEHHVHYAQQPTHPEYVIRLSRILELSAAMSGDSGMYHLVHGFVRELKEDR